MEYKILLSERFVNYTEGIPEYIQKERKVDTYQKIFMSYFTSPFFFWTTLILVMNGKNWKRPMVILLIIHWMLRSMGDLLYYWAYLKPEQMAFITPETKERWYIGVAIANIFWASGEIVGDWYFFIRTKIIINDEKKIRPVLITCIIYNITKVYSIIFYFIEIPKCVEKIKKDQSKIFAVMIELGLRWYYVLIAIQIASFIYDLSIIICLRKNLFKDLKYTSVFQKDSFIDRFKKVSEYRIYISMMATFLFLPMVVLFIVIIFKSYKNPLSSPLYINGIDHFRKMIIGINLSLIYIDQILLRYYVDNGQPITGKLLIEPSNAVNSNFSSYKISEDKSYSEMSNTYNIENKSSSEISNISNLLTSDELSLKTSNYNNNYNNNNNNNNNNNIEDITKINIAFESITKTK